MGGPRGGRRGGALVALVLCLVLAGSPARATDTSPRLIAYGHSWPSGLGVDRAYPLRVAERLDLTLVDRAHAGDLASATLDRVRAAPPRRNAVVVVQTGLNDARLFGAAGLEAYRAVLRAILRELRHVRLVVLVLDHPTVQPLALPPFDLGTAEVVRAYRHAAREIARQRGATVAAPVLDQPAYWQPDGCHPSGLGHRVIADAVAGAIRRSGVL